MSAPIEFPECFKALDNLPLAPATVDALASAVLEWSRRHRYKDWLLDFVYRDYVLTPSLTKNDEFLPRLKALTAVLSRIHRANDGQHISR